jgi:hypothetical protein
MTAMGILALACGIALVSAGRIPADAARLLSDYPD